MKNINQDSQSSSEVLSTYQIVNNIPEKQTIVLQNTNENYPIQLRIDPVTDYTALGITVFASLIVSVIAAMVTVLLVKDSNKNLINTQKEAQENLFRVQKKELNTKNRSERLNQIRELAYKINVNSNIISRLVFEVKCYKLNPKIQINEFLKKQEDYQNTLKDLMISYYSLRLYLVDKSQKEQIIISNIDKYIVSLGKLDEQLELMREVKTWNEYLTEFGGNEIHRLSDQIAISIEDYIKDEWGKILNLTN